MASRFSMLLLLTGGRAMAWSLVGLHVPLGLMEGLALGPVVSGGRHTGEQPVVLPARGIALGLVRATQHHEVRGAALLAAAATRHGVDHRHGPKRRERDDELSVLPQRVRRVQVVHGQHLPPLVLTTGVRAGQRNQTDELEAIAHGMAMSWSWLSPGKTRRGGRAGW